MSEQATQDKTELAKERRDIEKHKGERTSGGSIQRLEVKSFGELERLATVLATSDIVPKDMRGKAANVLLALMFGNELGLSPAQALQNVMVVNGRPTLWGDAVMGLVENSGLQDWWKDEYKPGLDGGTFVFTTKRRGREPVIRTFSMQDAAKAKLDKKEGPWQEYTKRMLFHRARSWALRDVYPDVLKGIRYYEEERDVIDTTATRTEREYALPKETTEAPAAGAASAETAAAAPASDKFEETSFKVGGGGTGNVDDTPCFYVRDDAETTTKYYHNNEDWHAKVKAAKEAGAFVTVGYIEKPSKKGATRWLVAFSLKS